MSRTAGRFVRVATPVRAESRIHSIAQQSDGPYGELAFGIRIRSPG